MSRFQTMGDIMGEMDGDDLEGDDVEGFDVVGDDEVIGVVKRNPRTGRKQIVRVPARAARTMALPPKPGWRKEGMAPGVIQPNEGMVPLPLIGTAGAIPGQFAVGLAQITFQGQLQKPFRAERLLVSTVRNTVTANSRLLGQLFVGTDLQQGEITGFDIELIGQATSFGTRLTCQPAEPGVLIRLIVTATPALSVAGDTILTNCMFMGRIIH